MRTIHQMMPNRCRIMTGLATLLLAPLTVVAMPAVRESAGLSSPVETPSLLGFGASLILVIAAIVVVGWLYRRLQGTQGGTSNVINILASQSLGAKEKIVLVEVGNKQIVVGMTSAHLQTLHVFDEPIVSTPEHATNSAFAERLLAAIKGAGK